MQDYIGEFVKQYPLLEDIKAMREVVWDNPKVRSAVKSLAQLPLNVDDIQEASDRLSRFAPFIKKAFPETAHANGIIESPLKEIPFMKMEMERYFKINFSGRLLLKCDHHLPIAGSIKARGGIYEVLKHAEQLAIEHGMLKKNDDYSKLLQADFQRFFSHYSIAVGSTGNLGLSIGIISAKLGFKVTVHMSSDAKQWKKELLRSKGVRVVEYADDYSKAVTEGRRLCEESASCYFIDDEDSEDLFLGYSVAALKLKGQLEQLNIKVDKNHPLFVYLPCGVGGGPGGVTFGLKHVFGDDVHCFFAEPTHSPSMLIGMLTGQHDKLSVYDFGIDNQTAADGLAVGRPSSFVGKMMDDLLKGIFTVDDDKLFELLALLEQSENIRLEPSALAGMYGPIQNQQMESNAESTHLVWATGGSLVPEEVMEAYIKQGRDLLRKEV